MTRTDIILSPVAVAVVVVVVLVRQNHITNNITAGYDILVKNCVAHNGGKQRMQLIDSNG